MHPQLGVPSEDVKIRVVVEQGKVGADCHRRDQAVDQAANGLAAESAAPVQLRRSEKVG
jgi:hypothetical protein